MKALFDGCYKIMSIAYTVEGFTFTLWQLFMFLAVLYFMAWIVYGIFK